MNIIIVGCGKVGSRLAQTLSDEGHDVVVVDNDKDSFKALKPDFNGLTVTGVPIDQDVLKQAGIENVDAFTAVTPDDNVNIMACQVAKEIFNVPKVIARIYNPELEHAFSRFRMDTLCPTNIIVDVMRAKILYDTNTSHCTISGNTFTFSEETVNSEYEGKKLDVVKLSDGRRIFGIIQNGSFNFPNSDITLNKGDILIIAYLTH